MTNAYLIWEYQRKSRLGLAKDSKVRSQHRAFYEAVVTSLLEDPTGLARPCRTNNYKALPPIRLTRPIEVHKRVQRTRTRCFFCWYLEYQKKKAQKAQTTFPMPKIQGSHFTKYSCSHCNIALCVNCFIEFHYFIQ